MDHLAAHMIDQHGLHAEKTDPAI